MSIHLAVQADSAGRHLALTALDRTLLVEAGAGSGKTSLLAGRVLMLLASGRAPGSIAAITFTELAASELRERIVSFVNAMTGGIYLPDLAVAFPRGPSLQQVQTLKRARDALDDLTVTTIHGFCLALLGPYPVEAEMDPGAAIMDPGAADVLFGEIFEDWVVEQLSSDRGSDDLLTQLFLDDVSTTHALLWDLADGLRRHHGAEVPALARCDVTAPELREAVAGFRRFMERAEFQEPETVEILEALEDTLEGIPRGHSEAVHLLHLLRLQAPACCAKGEGEFKAYRFKGKWKSAGKGLASGATADRLFDEAKDRYEACVAAHEAVQAYAAGRLLHLLSAEVRTVLDRFAAAKRETAVIDFDDLLVRCRILLATHPVVRDALKHRFAAVLVDEFQDTDPLQCEILWRLTAEPAAGDDDAPWQAWRPRPGALFLVGDPKQAIYRFRGADVASYVSARNGILGHDEAAVVSVSRNFRSVDAILDWVNGRFAGPLSADGQPGFAALFTDVAAGSESLSVATIKIEAESTFAEDLRDAEAEAVATLCRRLIGTLPLRDGRLCQADDIALLAPSGTELWRYEKALEDVGIAVSTQAGKGFFRRQEVHDLVALARVLADGRDTLALGALLRGPLVGLTEEALLDATAALPTAEDDRPKRLSVWTEPDLVAEPLLRETLTILRSLARHARSTTPFLLLCAAVEELRVRPILRARVPRTAERALANVDLFLEAARAYDVRGIRAFAADMQVQWEEASRTLEGRPDSEHRAVSLVTMHSAKGLEWPVVIPVNTVTRIKNGMSRALDRTAGHLHMPVLGRMPPGAALAFQAEEEALALERQRLLYVATTRARDLLLMPRPTEVPKGSWLAAVDFDLASLPEVDLEDFAEAPVSPVQEPDNHQDRDRFVAEAAAIVAATRQIERVTPHLSEATDVPAGEGAAAAAVFGSEGEEEPLSSAPAGQSRPRSRASQTAGRGSDGRDPGRCTDAHGPFRGTCGDAGCTGCHLPRP